MQQLVDAFIGTANAFDVEATLALFTPDARIEDESVGSTFDGTDGVRLYLKRFFVGYRTVSKCLSLVRLDDATALVRLDFTGDFGHEIGVLKIKTSADGRIERIDADLE
jgi:hypothetical protein